FHWKSKKERGNKRRSENKPKPEASVCLFKAPNTQAKQWVASPLPKIASNTECTWTVLSFGQEAPHFTPPWCEICAGVKREVPSDMAALEGRVN
ncbi:hypothetical protein KUCAC02_009842, partial [Chaenocephalus aceratus]